MQVFLIGANSHIIKSVRAVLPSGWHETSFASEESNGIFHYSQLSAKAYRSPDALLVVVLTPSLQNARIGLRAGALDFLKTSGNRKILLSSVHANLDLDGILDSNKLQYVKNLKSAEVLFSSMKNSAILRVANFIGNPNSLPISQRTLFPWAPIDGISRGKYFKVREPDKVTDYINETDLISAISILSKSSLTGAYETLPGLRCKNRNVIELAEDMQDFLAQNRNQSKIYESEVQSLLTDLVKKYFLKEEFSKEATTSWGWSSRFSGVEFVQRIFEYLVIKRGVKE